MPFTNNHSSIIRQYNESVPPMIAFSVFENQPAAPAATLARAVESETSEPADTFINSQEQQRDENQPTSAVWERRKRWKKPAIKKLRRFGVDIPINLGYHLAESSSDEESRDDTGKVDNGNGHDLGTKLPRRARRKVSYDPADIGTEPKKVRKGAAQSCDATASRVPKKPTPRVASSKTTTVAKKPKTKSKYRSKSNKRKPQLKVRSFDHRIEDLRKFKLKHGHCDVPYTYEANQSLSNWCSNVRYSYGVALKGKPPTIKMTGERIQRLKAIGFQFRLADGRATKKA